jgi:hypothetical protein
VAKTISAVHAMEMRYLVVSNEQNFPRSTLSGCVQSSSDLSQGIQTKLGNNLIIPPAVEEKFVENNHQAKRIWMQLERCQKSVFSMNCPE